MSREKTEYVILVVGESVEMGDEILVGKREEMGWIMLLEGVVLRKFNRGIGAGGGRGAYE